MKTKSLIFAIALLFNAFAFAQDEYVKKVFIQSEAQNKTMFETDGYKISRTLDYENGNYMVNFVNSSDTDYELIYNKLGHLQGIIINTEYDDTYYENLRSSCKKNCTVLTPTNGADYAYKDDRYAYYFTEEILFSVYYVVEIWSLEK